MDMDEGMEAQGTEGTEEQSVSAEEAGAEANGQATDPGDYEARLSDPQFAAEQAKNFQRKFRDTPWLV